jgi:hypothetical protein
VCPADRTAGLHRLHLAGAGRIPRRAGSSDVRGRRKGQFAFVLVLVFALAAKARKCCIPMKGGVQLDGAADCHAEAATRWQQFGNVPERAHALLGHGRCLRALGRLGAEQPLREARDLFAAMGYKPPLAETDALLEQAVAAALNGG